MIPYTISWKYQRTDIESASCHGICSPATIAVSDILIKDMIPPHTGEFTMFLVMISRMDKCNFIISTLRTNENLMDNDIVVKGSYYTTYLIPSKISIVATELLITDLLRPDVFIRIDNPEIFSDKQLNIITLPENTFTFN